MGLITRQIEPDAKGSKLTFTEMDNNLYYLQSLGVSGLTFSANTLTITNPTGGTISVNIASDTNTFITASTYNQSTNTITLTDNTNTNFNAYINAVSGLTVNGILSATTISGSTLYGNLIDSKYLQTTVTVTAADFLGTAPGGTVKVLIPPVGAGKYLRLNTLVGKFKNATVAYNTMPGLTVGTELSPINNLVSLVSLGTTEEIVSVAGNNVATGINGSIYLVYKISGSTPTVGDGDLIFEIEYQILDF